LPTFLVVVDELDKTLSRWHSENEELHSGHYSTLSRYLNPNLYASTPCVLDVCWSGGKRSGGKREKVLCKYVVTSKSYFERDLVTWNQYLLPLFMRGPVLCYDYEAPEGGKLLNEPRLSLSGSSRAQKINLLHHVRLSLLQSPRVFPLVDLLSLAATGETTPKIEAGNRARLPLLDSALDDGWTCNSLLLLHQYSKPLERLNSAWNMEVHEGDALILAGRYQPRQFGDAREGQGERMGEGSPEEVMKHSGERYGLCFEDSKEAELVREIVEKTNDKIPLFAQGLFAKSATGQAPVVAPEIAEALRLLQAKTLLLNQSYSNSAHCSLYHQLPTSVQNLATHASAKARLNRILNPFSLLDSTRNGDVLGGPLPWEQQCVAAASQGLNRKALAANTVANVISKGPLKASMYGVHKWLGKSLLA
ncbi:hypothetical protein GNI_000430, partial [Gregarina niphandrodes]